MSVVEAVGLTKRFGRNVAVRDLDLEVTRGSVVGLIGPSGSGKTTTVRMVLGAVNPSAGSVRVLGLEPSSFGTDERLRIGYMPQLPALYPTLSIQENLRFAGAIYGLRRGRDAAIRRLLEFVELEGHERTRLRHASGGMQRRTALAAALLHEPELLVLDEPTAGIDPVLRRKFWDRFVGLRDAGKTVLVTTQYVGEAARCDLVAFIKSGQLVAFASPAELTRQAFGGDLLDIRVNRALDGRLLAAVTELPAVTRVEEVDPPTQRIRVVVDDAHRGLVAVTAGLEAAGA